MPVPEPRAGEAQNAFISRCVSTLSSEDPGRDNDQVVAICYSQWQNKEGSGFHPHFQRILSLFLSRHGENLGIQKFWNFVNNLRLNTAKSYITQARDGSRFREKFDWAKPSLHFLRADKQAKYYAVNCIHAIVSMNNRDYTDVEDITGAGKSMNFRPVNLNHDHSTWFSYPRTRLDYAKYEDLCVEGILRVDNQDAYLQKCLDHDPSIPEKEWIDHPSIEGRPDLDKDGYHFTGIALLQRGYSLPGDPLSEVMPLFESVPEGEVCLFVDGMKVCLECEGEETPVNLESFILEKMKGDNMSEDSGPINPEGAVCPQCGHKITPDPTIEAKEIECPRCGTPMERLPAKTVEDAEAITDEQRAMAFFKLTVEEWNSLPDEKKAEYLKKLKAATKEELEASEEYKELFRPPFPNRANSQFKKTTGQQLANRNKVIGVGEVDGATIGIVEYTQLKADFEEYKLTTLKEKEFSDALVSKLREENATLNESLAAQRKVNAKGDALQAQLSETINDVATVKAELSNTKGELQETRNIITARDTKIDLLNTEIADLNEAVGKLKGRSEDLVAQLHEALEKSATNTQKAINETQRRAGIQEEMAALREKVASLTREISDLTEKLATQAKDAIRFENEAKELKEALRTQKEQYEAQILDARNTLKKARDFQKWAYEKLTEKGLAVAVPKKVDA